MATEQEEMATEPRSNGHGIGEFGHRIRSNGHGIGENGHESRSNGHEQVNLATDPAQMATLAPNRRIHTHQSSHKMHRKGQKE